MELEALASVLDRTGFEDATSLPFGRPTGTFAAKDPISAIPRYLFRTFDKKSDGATDEVWVKSRDAEEQLSDARTDIFSRQSLGNAAAMINMHLQWDLRQRQDNLVSWTSSLLFAIQYIFYRSAKNRTSLDQISLCVVDTKDLPARVFIRDMDLIIAFSPYSDKLRNFRGLRNMEHKTCKEQYYFGEYLSQGVLRIEGNCSIITAKELIDGGLHVLRPELAANDGGPAVWANEVIKLREVFFDDNIALPDTDEEELNAAMRIAELFGARFSLPVAASLLSLKPRRKIDGQIIKMFQAQFTGDDRKACSPVITLIPVYDTLPEVCHFRNIMESIWHDACAQDTITTIGTVVSSLRSATVNGYALKEYFDQAPHRIQMEREGLLHQLETLSILLEGVKKRVGDA